MTMTMTMMGVAVLAAELMLQSPQAAEVRRYGVLVELAGDTTSVERVVREPRRARSEVLLPDRARLEVTVTTDGSGCPTAAVVEAFPWRSAPGGTPQQRVSVRLDEGLASIEARGGGAVRAFTQEFPGAQVVIARETDALSTPLLVECALAGGREAATFRGIAFPGLRPVDVEVTRRGNTAVVVAEDTFEVALDDEGRPAGYTAGRGYARVTWLTEEAMAAIRFVAPRYEAPTYDAPPGAPYRAEDVRFPSEPGVMLAGTLTVPRGAAGPIPAVVTVSGTGPQDRDSHAPIAGGWRPFRDLADILSRTGYAVLRFDDRGVGASTGDPGAATEETAAVDVQAAVAYLRSRSDIDGERIVLLGHSQGVRIAMAVAAEDARLAGLVLMSGAADTWAAVRAQTRWVAEREARAGRVAPDSVAVLVEREMERLADSGASELLGWDADEVARRIRVPRVAVFHGATDRQVPADQAWALADAFRRAGVADVTVRVFEGLNHLLVEDSSGDFLGYDDLPSADVSHQVLGAVRDWMGGLGR